jgi:hypothetical protein
MQQIKQMFGRFLLWIGAAGLLLGLSACGRAAAYFLPRKKRYSCGITSLLRCKRPA